MKQEILHGRRPPVKKQTPLSPTVVAAAMPLLHRLLLCLTAAALLVAGKARAVDLDPVLVGKLTPVVPWLRPLAVQSNLVFAGMEGGLAIIDVSNPADPQWLGSYATGRSPQDVAISGNYAYVVVGDPGLQVIDVSNPANPRRVGGYFTGWAVGVAVSDNYAYVAGVGLQILDVSNPADPHRVGDFGGHLGGLMVSGNYAYVGDWYVGLQILNVSNPGNPHRVGAYHATMAGVVSGNYAYVADGVAGMQIIDVSNPGNPQRVGGYDTSGAARAAWPFRATTPTWRLGLLVCKSLT
jgi:hypothetical protein